MAGGPGDIREDSIELDIEPALTSNRVTVFFRLILVIPHLLALGLYSIVALFFAMLSWFAALFTGEVPDGLFDTLADYVGYQARVLGYLFFLTDRYPPFFKGRGDDFPIVIRVHRGRLNRLAVLFRIALFIPAMIINLIFGYGMNSAGPVLWLLTVIMGRVPKPMYGAYAAGVRYSTRVNGYLLMVTATYPWGVLGDRSDTESREGSYVDAPPASAPAPSFGTPVVFGEPESQQSVQGATSGDDAGASTIPAAEVGRGVISAPVGSDSAVDASAEHGPGDSLTATSDMPLTDSDESSHAPGGNGSEAGRGEAEPAPAVVTDPATSIPSADPWASAPPPSAVAASPPPPAPVPSASAPPATDAEPSDVAEPTASAPAYGLPTAPPLPPAGYLPPAQWSGPGGDADVSAYVRAPRWSWVLDQSSKTLIFIIMVLGVGTAIVSGRADNSRLQAAYATNAVQNAQNNLATATQSFETTVTGCNGQIACVTQADATLGQAVHQWSVTVARVSMPASALAAKSQAIAAHDAFAADLAQLSQATDVSTYESMTTSLGVVQAGNDLDQSTVELLAALRAAGG